jgi:preprotein translocase subunit SecE
MSDSAGTATGLGSADGGDGDRPAERGSAPVRRERRPGRLRRSVGGSRTYVRQVLAELRKVIWPTRRDLVTYTAVVLVFVLFMVAVVSLYDFGFSQAVLAVFG